MMTMRISAALVSGAMLMLPAVASAQTETWPAKAVRMITPFPPGGSVDVIARLIGPKLSESLGKQVIIDNRTGASGNIGTEMAARAAPDGYTLLINTLPLVTNIYLFSRVPYDLQNDFEPVILLSSSTAMLAVHPSLPVRSTQDLLNLARSKRGTLNYGTAGIGTNPHIAGELFNYLGKTNIVAVHYKGGGPSLIAAISGEVTVSFSNIAETLPYTDAKRLRGLAITSLKRRANMPDMPTIAEGGVPGYEFLTWHVIMAPKGKPRAITTLLNERLRKILNTPDQIQQFAQKGVDVIASTPEEAAAHLKREMEKWSRVVKERDIRAE
jgi:tripartite-type tricarboxylate transporter receptor subunit TctC